jgi:RNA polymerase sigma-70 factor (ECF subfamily)
MARGTLDRPSGPAAETSYDQIVLPHLAAGLRLARWLTRNEHDAEDVVQEASLRALRYFSTFSGGDGRAWFLRIVRNAARDLGSRGSFQATEPFDEEVHTPGQTGADPEALVLQIDDLDGIDRALKRLPERARELLVLRELEFLSYRELAETLEIPIGTVMSGLSRARQQFREVLGEELSGDAGRQAPAEVETTGSSRSRLPGRSRSW